MLVIFDLDGTLVDSWDWMAGELAGSAERFGYRRLDRTALERLRGLETSEVLAELSVPPERLAALVEHLRASAETADGAVGPFPGAKALLTRLKQAGDELALVSSNSRIAVARALGTETLDVFDLIGCGSGVFDKAAALRTIVADSGHQAGAVVCVGDETRDLDAATEAGLDAIAVEWGYAGAQLLRRKAPGRTAASFDDLGAMLAARRAASPGATQAGL